MLAIGGGLAGILFLTALALSAAGGPMRGILGGSEDGSHRAAIVDQLSLTAANPGFVERTRELLESNGYGVDYFEGTDVTVDLYRTLPERGYDLVILRVHSTAEVSRGEEDVTSVSLFTGQNYSRDLYHEEQVQGRVGFAQYTEDGPMYFGVTSDFVRDSMQGQFNDALVIMMGCQGFINDRGAEAFAEKGARTFIGWDGLVSAKHTDEAVGDLLGHIVRDGDDPQEAVTRTMLDVGPDPDFGSQLISRP
ncbi:MAG TPA: hypothetical protein VFP63_00945 [Dehalococcoidia bacterium]|nr:hypothetical protein [Dehalococcoidia bacterium]